jgi:large subunit ribosomal protein L13
MKTKTLKASEIKRNWHLVDAQSDTLGRLSVHLANLLSGKSKTDWVPHLDCGDYVVLTNAAKLKVTGNKADQKIYRHHTGFPGGLKEIALKDQLIKDPKEIILHAVTGMLPKNKLRDQRLSRLKIFNDTKHTFEDKFSKK